MLRAFQGPVGTDEDPTSETNVYGHTQETSRAYIYLETIYDAYPTLAAAKERDTVVHEVGHNMADSGAHPVTDWDYAHEDDTPKHYKEAYLKLMRMADKPH